jgi:hypothetical protein
MPLCVMVDMEVSFALYFRRTLAKTFGQLVPQLSVGFCAASPTRAGTVWSTKIKGDH